MHDVPDTGWPAVSPRIRELFRRGAEKALDPGREWIERLHAATLSGKLMEPVAHDPVLAENTRRTNVANLLQWTVANVQQPGRRVPVVLSAEALDTARDLVRRGVGEVALDSYRLALVVVWRRWTEICFELTDNVTDLQELLQVSSLSISTFIDDTIAAVSEQMRAERQELPRGTTAERRAVVTQLLEGAAISRARAETQLGYRLSGPHVAVILWSATQAARGRVDAAADAVMCVAGAAHRLTIVASSTALWVWLPVNTQPDAVQLAAALAEFPDIRAATGRPDTNVSGFRRSHLEALTTQRTLTRLNSRQQVGRYEDMRLTALLTADPTTADDFVTDTLGGVVRADREVVETLSVWIQSQCNTARTAQRLFTHRNTVLRRLAHAEELLPRPLSTDLVNVAAALQILRWSGGTR
ncbi:helix-turn-helix domain-containing protein [Nocardia xishanensis]|uniref:PucR family transcriptional regulator n=1 Tax=Nocardia xishanensis TaxID=238964 RepID=UPI0033F82E98